MKILNSFNFFQKKLNKFKILTFNYLAQINIFWSKFRRENGKTVGCLTFIE